jgi:hypothetical protein
MVGRTESGQKDVPRKVLPQFSQAETERRELRAASSGRNVMHYLNIVDSLLGQR